ncbi:MAG: DUF167 domain-containing protein [Candidatus Peregrinibacteria bacterium]|nr:DUF167 domain-containing protein [Candidatus Peregrinibacteria bacterium]
MNLLNHLLQLGKKELRVKIKVIPSSPKNEATGIMADGAIKIRVHATPEQGKANAELIKFLAETLDIDTDDIEIISGHTSSRKEFHINLSRHF